MKEGSEDAATAIHEGVISFRGEIIEFATDLIEIGSVTGEEAAIQQWLHDYLEGMGLRVLSVPVEIERLRATPGFIDVGPREFHAASLVAIHDGSERKRSMLLNGHVDTVAAGNLEQWRRSPFDGVVTEGRLYGLGASDMKGGVAAIVMALKILRAIGRPPKGRVLLECVVDEEVTGYGTLACVARGFRADAAIVAETSDLAICPACIGRLWFEIEVSVAPLGIAESWAAPSALDVGIMIVEGIKRFERERQARLSHPLFSDIRSATPCVVCELWSGSHPSSVPTQARLRGSAGLLPFEDVAAVEAEIVGAVHSLAERKDWPAGVESVISFKRVGADGVEIPREHAIVSCLASAYERVTKETPIIRGRAGGSDLRYLVKYGSTPGVIFGPGLTSEMHKVDEAVPVENILQATEVIALATYLWCSEDRLRGSR